MAWNISARRVKIAALSCIIDQYIPKVRRKNIAMASINDKKTHDKVLQTWILVFFKKHKISDEIVKFIT